MRILDAQGEQLSLDELVNVIAEEERGCEFEAECYAAQGIEAWQERRGQLVQIYRCGWQSTNVGWCTRRRQFLLSREMEVKNGTECAG